MGDIRYDRNRSVARSSAQRYGRPVRRHPGRRVMPVWLVVILDLLFLGVALNAFALANSSIFVPVATGETLPKPPTPSVTQSPPPSPTPSITPTDSTMPTDSEGVSSTPTEAPTPTAPIDQGMWGAKFPDKFKDGAVDRGDSHYISKDINIKITKYPDGNFEWCIAEIFIRNKDNFKAFFATDTGEFKWYATDSTLDQANARNAILAVNGTNTANRSNRLGYELRNGGQLELAKPWQDVCVMYNDGTIKTFDQAGFEKEINDIRATGGSNGGVWQIWTFGPMLLDANGQPMTQFASEVTKSGNARTAIGYCEPGHYFFVTAGSFSSDPGARVGPSLAALSQKMYDLGCVAAYNMDGGQTSAMVFNGKLVNTPYAGGRSVSDIICICETGQ